MTTKLHVACDALGNPVRLLLSPGQVADCTFGEALIKDLTPGAVLGDKAYDSDALLQKIAACGAQAVIPPKANRLIQRPCDYVLYRERNRVERFFNKLKHYRAIATRYAKRARNFLGLACLAASIICLQ